VLYRGQPPSTLTNPVAPAGTTCWSGPVPAVTPEVQRLVARQRRGWFRDYVRTTIERDVVELSGIRKVAEMGQLLRLFAARTGCELVMQAIIDDAPLERQAVYDHRAWLETIHLVTTLPARSQPHPSGQKTPQGLPDRSGACRLVARQDPGRAR
jgi:hypothetical protein